MSPEEIAVQLEAIAYLLPKILQDGDDFSRAFEELTCGLLTGVAPEQYDEVIKALAEIAERSEFNSAFAEAISTENQSWPSCLIRSPSASDWSKNH